MWIHTYEFIHELCMNSRMNSYEMNSYEIWIHRMIISYLNSLALSSWILTWFRGTKVPDGLRWPLPEGWRASGGPLQLSNSTAASESDGDVKTTPVCVSILHLSKLPPYSGGSNWLILEWLGIRGLQCCGDAPFGVVTTAGTRWRMRSRQLRRYSATTPDVAGPGNHNFNIWKLKTVSFIWRDLKCSPSDYGRTTRQTR